MNTSNRPSSERLIIFDTTLRDGEQSPGASMRREELRIARQLERMKAELNAAFVLFKELADRKAEIFDEDIMALVSAERQAQENDYYRLFH